MPLPKVFQICCSGILCWSMRATNFGWGYRDYASAALSLLPRDGYCAPWHDLGRQATVPMPGVAPGTRADVSPGVYLRGAIL